MGMIFLTMRARIATGDDTNRHRPASGNQADHPGANAASNSGARRVCRGPHLATGGDWVRGLGSCHA